MLAITRSVEARRDVAEIWHFIAEDNFAAADKLISEFDRAIRLIAQFPGIGSDRSHLVRGLRGFPVAKYIVFYRRRRAGIEIVRVLHGARDLEQIFGRKK